MGDEGWGAGGEGHAIITCIPPMPKEGLTKNNIY